MNIFILDQNPVKAAQFQCDKHVVKMVLETAQLLCTAIYIHGGTAHYLPTHKGHPCTQWASKTRNNFNWLKEHGLALCEEYTLRYGKHHKSHDVIKFTDSNVIPSGDMTEFVQAMPDIYKDSDPVIAYRRYYRYDKANIAKWKYGNKPTWFSDDDDRYILPRLLLKSK